MEIRDLETAQHEAAHVVVGVRLGLRLDIAGIGIWRGDRKNPRDPGAVGFVSFYEATRGDLTAQAIMLAAGVAWDRMLGYDPWSSSYDYSETWKIVRGRKSVEACVTSAMAMLGGLTREHAKITRGLLVRDISEQDLSILFAGEAID